MTYKNSFVMFPMLLAAIALAACGQKAPEQETSTDSAVQAQIEEDAGPSSRSRKRKRISPGAKLP